MQDNNLDERVIGNESMDSSLLGLPPEILIEILKLTASDGTPGAAVSPLFLGRICRNWRDLVFATWAFWQRVNLSINLNYVVQFDLLEEWTRRAGSLPLTLSVVDRDAVITGSGSQPSLQRIVQLIQRLAPQISQLTLEMPVVFFDNLEESGLATYSWSLLSNLHLSTTSVNTNLTNPAKILDFSSCPNVTSCTIKKFYHSYIGFPWSSLRHLYFDSVFCTEIYDALKSATHLETLEARGIVEEGGFSADTITQQTLRRLSLSEPTEDECEDCTTLLASLCLPKLTSLIIELGSAGPSEEFVFNIQPLISLSKCQLTELSIENATLQQEVFIQCLSLLPSLRILQVMNIAWSPTIAVPSAGLEPLLLHRMLGTDSKPSLLPNLENLTFVGFTALFSAQVVIDLLGDRWRELGSGDGSIERSPLHSAIFRLNGQNWVITKEQEAMFEAWRRRGYILEVESTDASYRRPVYQ
ncbi:hypothetical protein DFP72DRAFT_905981 [Ephemerocybe angulata]|uniref:F-box domain-containing protein n=1 Tax=Ephemerocybe angulata TaxID=980116 RepID=A0A8H6M2H8_9AGAR|nr:hypothetical protein DFP72DRAFT_905981 [Tulosesus angulatus]